MQTIFKAVVGSQLYGLASEKSDKDFKGLFMPEKYRAFPTEEHYLGLKQFTPHKRQEYKIGEGSEKEEGTLYSVRYFLELFLKGNPTLTELPFIRDDFIIKSTELGQRIMKFVRENLITKHLFSGYMGYFSSQLRCFRSKSGKHREKRLENREEQTAAGDYDQKMMSHAYRIGVQGIDLFRQGEFNPTLSGEDLEIARKMKFDGPRSISRNEAIELLENIEKKLVKTKEESTLAYAPDFETIHQFTMNIMKEYYHV